LAAGTGPGGLSTFRSRAARANRCRHAKILLKHGKRKKATMRLYDFLASPCAGEAQIGPAGTVMALPLFAFV
jgi:hypothetical protein